MSIVVLIVALGCIGLLLWAVTTYVPMNPPMRNVIIAIVIVATVLFVLQAFGILGGLNRPPSVRID